MASGRTPDFENLLSDAAPAYLERKRSEIALYRQYLAGGDLASIRALSHKMKGTGSAYGFPMLSEFGASMESAAANGDQSTLERKIEELATYLAQMESR